MAQGAELKTKAFCSAVSSGEQKVEPASVVQCALSSEVADTLVLLTGLPNMAWRNALSKTLQELRIHVDQAGPASQGVREFLLANYAELKKANPAFPILIRESAGVEAKLVARYDYGVEKAVSVQGDNQSAVLTKLQDLIKAGEKLPRSSE